MSRRKPTRRGVILLVVLSLILLFTLVAVTYAIVASQYKLSAQATAKLQVVGDPPRKDLDMAAYLLLRDSSIPSSFTGHSLLRDLYGIDGVRGRVTSALSKAGGQFILMDIVAVNGTFSQQSGHYNGCVLTFVTGDQRGYSTRVVGYDPTASQLQIETQDNDSVNVALPSVGDEFVINGRPFNGTGFGYQPPLVSTDVPGLDAVVTIPLPSGMNPTTDVPVSLLPHFNGYGSLTTVQTDVGGADEPWDAVDPQNMHLAMVPPNAAASNQILPSFHRSDLIAYWIKWLRTNVLTSLTQAQVQMVFAYPYGPDNILGNADDSVAPWQNVPAIQRQAIVDLKRRMIFRPLPEDHPNFNGGNPMFTILGGTTLGSLDCDGDGRVDRWDVDNDGDGIPDSIWIDPGFPVVTAKDGRQYKKLVAALIRDLDGRINLNAMGALVHTNATYTTYPIAIDPNIPSNNQPLNLARGLGYGPADGYLGSLFGSNTNELTNILQGRYGNDLLPGIGGVDDALSAVKSLGIPNNYASGPQAFGTQPDLSGQGLIALDHLGQPVTRYMGGASETTDDPYESDPQRNRPEDALFTVTEMERILRYHDADVAQLPQRLLQAAPNVLGAASNRQVVTTLSSHIPVGNVALPFDLRTNSNANVFNYLKSLQNNAGRGPSLLDLYRVRLTLGGVSGNQLNTQMQKIVPFEILHGQKFDINRWFGNGLDDNGNGVIDEYEEETAGETVWPNTAPVQFQGVTFSYFNDNPTGPDPRQIFARQMYCLLRLVMDDGYIDAFPNPAQQPALNAAQKRELTYQRMAQWAINAVEFRDRDAIMTAFEYDVNPWNGWICDGNPATDETQTNFASNMIDDDGDGQVDEADEQSLGQDRRLVWGAEYPDLLMTENTAFHNRGVRDTDYDTNQQKTIVNMKRKDADMDQFRIPQGSWFMELYCPRNSVANNASFPYELYDSNTGKLDLGRMAPARTFGMSPQQLRHPVWRAVVTATPPNGLQAIAQTAPATTTFEPRDMGLAPERIIWFSPNAPGAIPEANLIYYGRTGSLVNALPTTQPATSNVLLPPLRYAVVGPRPSTVPSAFYAGGDGDTTTYDPGTDNIAIGGGTFAVAGYPSGYPVTAGNAGATIQSPVGIVCAANPPPGWTNANRQIGMNVSEPLPQSGNYYSEPNPSNDGRVPTDAYANFAVAHHPANNFVPDVPFDAGNSAAAVARRNLLGGSVATRTVNNHRTVFLQRLANPLAPWNPDPADTQYGAFYIATYQVNPYITVDWSSVDLTVYNGEDQNTEEQVMQGMNLVMEWRDQDDPDPYAAPANERFCTRERGIRQVNGPVDRNFWPPYTTGPRTTAKNMNDRCFPYEFKHTLGYLNWTASDSPTAPSVGYEGAPDTTAEQPFPWLAWNNRPYANPLELMMVPASSPGRLCWEFGTAVSGQRFFDATQGLPADPAREPYSYLLNFFLTSPTNTAGEAPHYYRLFDFVETPSPFVGTEKWYYASTFANTGTIDAATFRPPYNRLSRFREPGRMNINTIFDFREWQALANGFPAYNNQTFFQDKLVLSRRGYDASLYGDYPTIFANPFRSAAAADLMPNVQNMRKTGVEVGLLRPDPTAASINVATQPMFALPSGNQYDNTYRNPYFAYRGLNRLSNMVSTHSNVHAMWITVGYFYVEPTGAAPDAAHPDGLRLGLEVGSDAGTVERHRGFYLIDRSVPVAFEPGENHNVDRSILIRRFIE